MDKTLNGATRYLIFIAGMGGLLYGVDVGIVAAALLYLGQALGLTLAQQSSVVAAVFGGSTVGSLIAGFLADWLGRKTMMIASGLLFVMSVGVIVASSGFAMLFLGRSLQGLAGGVIAVVVPLYLAETLGPAHRGKGSAIFQLMLTIGIAAASIVGFFYTRQAEAAVAAAAGNAALIRAAQDHAWRGIFSSVVYPGLIFFVGTVFLSDSPRWLFKRGQRDKALAALRRTSSEGEAQTQLAEMESLAAQGSSGIVSGGGTLLQRKYVVPFVLACIILTCNQTTGINSILSYLVIILKQAGMSAADATKWDIGVKLLNTAMTLVAVALVDRKGRKFLLIVGTAGIIIALSAGAVVFRSFESGKVSVAAQVQQQVRGKELKMSPNQIASLSTASGPQVLTVVYSYGDGDKLVTALSTDSGVQITPQDPSKAGPLTIKHALYGPVPGEHTGWLVALCLALFISSFSVGPGVVVWLTLSELMPTRIRSGGMGIALLLNQGTSTLIAGVFLPVVGSYGYAAMFAFWSGCTVIYFLTAAFFLPETKGKTLEEIELGFEGRDATALAGDA